MGRERIIFIGRFEPFHKGHEYMVRALVKKYGKIVIGIGRIFVRKNGKRAEARTQSYPFTYAERKRMIAIAVNDLLEHIEFIPIDDKPSDGQWTKHVLSKGRRVGGFSGFITHNPWVARCLSPHIARKKAPAQLQRAKLAGTKIRALIKKRNSEWRNRVSRKVEKYLKTIHVNKRIA